MKRTIRKNRYGNIVGYIGRNRVEEFGDDMDRAENWSGWCIPRETERNQRRVSQGFDEISAFADAMQANTTA